MQGRVSVKKNFIKVVTPSVNKTSAQTSNYGSHRHLKKEGENILTIRDIVSKIHPENAKKRLRKPPTAADFDSKKVYLIEKPTSKTSKASTQPREDDEKSEREVIHRDSSPISKLMNIPS